MLMATESTGADIASPADLASLVQELTASWHPSGSIAQNRESHRFPFHQSLCMHCLDFRLQPVGKPLRIEGRDISVDGISFSHRHPLECRHVAVSFTTARGIESYVVRLTWCRYSRNRQYVSGGRFIPESKIEVRYEEPARLNEA